MSEKWLEFKVEDEDCPHTADTYTGCPLCEMKELKADNIRVRGLLQVLNPEALAVADAEGKKRDPSN